jgi:hypothetical protein
VLQYLVTSKVRRRLLLLLWGEQARGSVAELAELAGVAFASAHVELKAMQRAELVSSKRERGKEVFAANLGHPEGDALRALVVADRAAPRAATDDEDTVKRSLVALGLPLRGVDPLDVPAPERVSMLVRGAALARRDPVVARGLPLCFWRLRESLDLKALAAQAPRAEDKHSLGFFLELTGELGGDRRLVGLAEHFRDGRMTSLRGFFQASRARREVFRDFPLAAKWGFQMNMDAGSFRTLFEKFVVHDHA